MCASRRAAITLSKSLPTSSRRHTGLYADGACGGRPPFPQQHETRRTPRPWVGALLQASGEQVPQTGSQDVDRLRPDSAWDPIRTRRHVAGCHPLRGFEQLFLRHSKFLVLFRQRCPVGGGRGWRGRVVVIPPWEQGPGHVIQ